jgi:manganese/iron transport system permease protein
VACVGFVVVGHRALLMGTFDEAQATLAGFRPALTNLSLMVFAAVAVVSSFQAVGNLLVFAFLVAPPATATLLVRRVPRIMLAAIVIGWLCVAVGLVVSYHAGTATGATMALCTVVVFVAVVAVTAVRRGR